MDRGGLKHWLQQALEAGNFEQISKMAVQERSLLSLLVARSYDSDERIASRSVQALGLAAGSVSDEDPEVVRELLRRQMWLLCDESGANGWTAEACMDAILTARPGRFPEFEKITQTPAGK